MSDHVFATALRDYLKLKDELDKFSELKKSAFVVFKLNYPNSRKKHMRISACFMMSLPEPAHTFRSFSLSPR